MSRYRKTRKVLNAEDIYVNNEIMENRGVKKVIQYKTHKFKKITKEQWESVRFDRHYWTNGDRYWKLANKYYGDPSMWWVIARWNFKPTESHLNEGDEIRIPLDLKRVLELIR